MDVPLQNICQTALQPTPQTTLQATLLLHHLPGVGPSRYWRLLEHFATALQVVQHPAHELHLFLPEQARELLADYQRRGSASLLGQALARTLDWLDAHPDTQLLDLAHPDYPQLLREIHRPPALLYIQGNRQCLNFPQIAIVGSRNPTPGGRDNAFAFARYLAAHGFTITSGLALGVDGAAHQGALAAQGHTIAVFGTGIDRIYPARHKKLAAQIVAEGGALISEFPLATRSQAGNFPQRNRLISGLSLGTLVVEAAVQSGSLITARQALQQNREVFALPGSIHNPLARGCHCLIRDGATLVETGEDIVAQLGGLLALKREEAHCTAENTAAASAPILDSEEQILLAHLGYDPTPFELLVDRSQLPVGRLSAQLLGLELKGAICATAHGYVRKN